MGRQAIDRIGHTFGLLTVIERAGYDTQDRVMWACLCDCGNEVTIVGSHLHDGSTVSCGCHRRSKSTTHGMSRSPEYAAWKTMRQRCSNPNSKNWPNYGGRGIRVCREWDASFEAFMTAVGRRPASDLSLDRIDNDGNYEPGNVRWATRSVQQQNRRPFRVGLPKIITEMADALEEAGIRPDLVQQARAMRGVAKELI